MKLSSWLDIPNPDGSRKRRREFAARIGVTPSMVTAYCEDRMWPGREKMEAIARETDGDVTANDFIGIHRDGPRAQPLTADEAAS